MWETLFTGEQCKPPPAAVKGKSASQRMFALFHCLVTQNPCCSSFGCFAGAYNARLGASLERAVSQRDW